MKKFIGAALAVAFSISMCSCTNSTQSTDDASLSESVAATDTPTEEPTPDPTADMTLNADGNLDGMEYKYNSSWAETSDPLTNATLRTYDINLGSNGTIQLRLTSVNDEGTSAAVQNLRTQSDVDRETVINSMLAAKEGTLTNASSERAATPPSGTRAMWAYEGTEGDNIVHGYSYVGGSQLYEISVATVTDEAYSAFEPTWKSIVNQLKFQEIAPVETPSPTPEPTPVPTPKPTKQAVSSASTVEEAMDIISSRFRPYVGKVVFHDVEYSPENNYYYYHLSVEAWHPDGDYAYDNGEPGDVYGYLNADTNYIAVGDLSLEEWADYYA